MPEDNRREMAKLIVTSGGLSTARQARFALRTAVPGARIRSTGFRAIFFLEAQGDLFELARRVNQECAEQIGHVTAVLFEVESRFDAIKEAAVKAGTEQIAPDEKFCFRLHKRGSHALEQDTLTLEQEIGGAIWTALEQKHGKKPSVNLRNPDITVTAEVLGPNTAVGISRRAWREKVPPA